MIRWIICAAAALVCALAAAPVAAADTRDETDARNRPNLCCNPRPFFVLPLKPVHTPKPIRGEDNPGSLMHRIARRIAHGPPEPVVVIPWLFDLKSIGVSTLGRF